jgi:pimeloyl-ACP methyl ester carboxylesterase
VPPSPGRSRVARPFLALAFVAATIVPAAGAQAAGAAVGAPGLAWKACRRSFECASLSVPVDHAAPHGEQLELAVIRAPARDPSQRIGSLVVNFGGPGDPGTDTLRLALDSFPETIRDRFDIVSFDPRGTGASRPVDCVDDATFDRLWDEDPTPNSAADLPKFYDGSVSPVDFVKACIDTQGPWLAQVGTRNVARDLDLLRGALGDPKLTFLGYSYGTVIGAVYAQMFPNHVRALVLDSPVDLSDTASDELHGNAVGFETALGAFLDDCAADTSCSFHSKGHPRGALETLRSRFEQGLVQRSADGRKARVSEFYATLLAGLYERDSWPILAQALHESTTGDGTLLRAITDSYAGRGDDGRYDNIQEAIGVISCDDRRDPKVSFDTYRASYEELTRDYPFFGPVLGGEPLGCDPRLPSPPAAEQLGDVRSTAAPPALVVGTTKDPVTPYAGAQDLRRRLRGSRLLTFDSTEHGSYGEGIACIDDAVNAYLLTRHLPARGTVCSR